MALPDLAGSSPGPLSACRMLVATAHRKFSVDRAKRDFGYQPKVSLKEGLDRTLTHYSHLRADAGGSPGTAAKPKAA
jgi:nucleoside-diphosphate-sugar epimerase